MIASISNFESGRQNRSLCSQGKIDNNDEDDYASYSSF